MDKYHYFAVLLIGIFFLIRLYILRNIANTQTDLISFRLKSIVRRRERTGFAIRIGRGLPAALRECHAIHA